MAVQLTHIDDVPSQAPNLETYLNLAEACREGPKLTYDRQYLEDAATACLAEAAYLFFQRHLTPEQSGLLSRYLDAADVLYSSAGFDPNIYFPDNLKNRLDMIREGNEPGHDVGIQDLVAAYTKEFGPFDQPGQYH